MIKKLLILLLLSLAGDQKLAAAPRMAFTGPIDTSNSEYASKLGKNWWAICEEGSSTTIKKVKLVATPGEPTDKPYQFIISAEGCSNAVFLLQSKEWKWLAEGSIETGKISGDQPWQDIRFKGETIGITDKEDSDGYRGIYLILKETPQRIFGLNNKIWDLKWAGDVDRDGKIDLLLSFSNVDDDEESSIPESKLFLSTYGNDITPLYPAVKAGD